MGPPDYLGVDQGTAYISDEFRSNAEAHGIKIQPAPIETPGSIGIVERYHAPLRRSFTKIRESLDRTKATDEECLKMAVFAVNSTMGPEGLIPMLLVFGAIPRPARTILSPTQLERQKAIEAARHAAQHEQAKRRVAFALRHPSGPKAKEASAALQNLPPGSKVMVYRTKSKSWEGPFRFIDCEGETAVIQLPRGRRVFRSVCVKPWIHPIRTDKNYSEPSDDIDRPANNLKSSTKKKTVSWSDRPQNHANHKTTCSDDNSTSNCVLTEPAPDTRAMVASSPEQPRQEPSETINVHPYSDVKNAEVSITPPNMTTPHPKISTISATNNAADEEDLGTKPRKVKVRPGSREERMFTQPRRDELNGLLKIGTFLPRKLTEVPDGARFFGARFVDEIKRAGQGLRKKSRFVSQNYCDEEATTMATKAPTVQRYSQRVACSIGASYSQDLKAIIRDIIQAYI